MGSLDSGPQAFGDVVDLAGDGATIYVSDRLAKEIVAFGPEGDLLRRFGHRGGGPGELRHMLHVSILWQDPNRIWVGEPPSLFLFDSLGTSVARPATLPWSWPWRGHTDTLGSVYSEFTETGELELRGQVSLDIRSRNVVRHTPVWTRSGQDMGTIELPDTLPLPVLESPTRTLRRGGNYEIRQLPMRPQILWAASPNGAIWVVNTAEYRLNEVAFTGDTVRTIEVDRPRTRLTGDERDSLAAVSGFAVSEIPRYRPMMDRLDVAPDGWIWVCRNARDGLEWAFPEVSSRPSQYMSLTLGPDGTLAFIRGAGGLINGARIEEKTDFEVVVAEDGTERTVTDVRGSVMAQGRAPHTVHFDQTGEWLYYTEFVLGNVAANPGLSADTLVLRRVRPDGTGKTTLYRFPHAERAALSPDLGWIVFREYQRSFVTPFEWIGKPVTISAYDGIGFTSRIDPSDGASMAWFDAATVSWPRGGTFHEKALDDIPTGTDGARTTDITVRYEVALPSTTVTLTNARVITMDEERSVLESATVLLRGHRIAEVGPNVVVPAEARVFDLAGHTVIPGLVDAHAHSVGQLATTQLIEQRLPGVTGSLAHGVTTLYELYGSEEKEPWVSDMIRSGRTDGPRMLSVGAPMYGIREYRPRTYRPIASYDAADQHARFSRDIGITRAQGLCQLHPRRPPPVDHRRARAGAERAVRDGRDPPDELHPDH